MDDSTTYGYMDLWYRTISGLGMAGVIFHDDLSPSFVAKYETPMVKFVQVEGIGSSTVLSANDVRFDVFADWLQVRGSWCDLLMRLSLNSSSMAPADLHDQLALL